MKSMWKIIGEYTRINLKKNMKLDNGALLIL